MILSLKEFIVVFAIAIVVFRLAKPVLLKFASPQDLARRQMVWLCLTATAFFATSFWLFALLAIPLTIWAGRRDSNPCALYLMLLVIIPPIEVPLPMIGMPYLLMMSNFLILSFCIMTPVALRLFRSKDKNREIGLRFTDFCLIAYGLLTAVLYVHTIRPDGGLYPATFTDACRRGFVFFFDVWVPYYAISRASADRAKLVEMMATYSLSCALLAAIGIFEAVRHWYLYGEMAVRLGAPGPGAQYLMRGTSLRAMASTGHAMALAYMLVPAYGFWLYLKNRVSQKRWRYCGTIIFWGGLFAAYTRGAWIGAVLVYFLFAALQPHSTSRIFKATSVAFVMGTFIYFSPLGDKVVSVLPGLGGTVDNDNIIYRERLWHRSWEIIQHSPFFGDQEAMLKMADVRQGEGKVDLINAYAGILLDNGFVGLALFASFILSALYIAWLGMRGAGTRDDDLPLIGAGLVACIIGMLLMFANGNFGGGPAQVFYVLAAFGVGYGSMVRLSGQDVQKPPLLIEGERRLVHPAR